MVSKRVVDSDAFLDLPLTAQALYFHLLTQADDDGFVDNCRKIVRMICASEDDLELLFARGYLISFPTGVAAIRHWRVHNYIKGDRYRKTPHFEELSQLDILPNREYQLKKVKESFTQAFQQSFPQGQEGPNAECIPQENQQGFQQSFQQSEQNFIQNGSKLVPSCVQVGSKSVPSGIQTDSKVVPQDRIDKDRIDKISIDEDRAAAAAESSSSSSTEEDDILEAVITEFGRALPGLKAPAKVEKLKGLICGRSLDYFRELFAKAAESPFLSEVREGQWSCSLEWLMKPENSEKVMSGMYARYKPTRTDPEPSQTYTNDAGVMEGFDTTAMFEAALRRGMAGGGKA